MTNHPGKQTAQDIHRGRCPSPLLYAGWPGAGVNHVYP